MASHASYSVQVKWDGSTWTEEWSRVKSLTINRGRDGGMLSTPQAGKLDLLVKNADKRFSPAYSSSPIYANLLPGKEARVRAIVGRSVSLDGTAYLQMGTDVADFKITTHLSFGCAFKRSGTNANQRLIAKGGAFELRVDGTSGVVAELEIGGVTQTATDATATGTGWMLAIVTFDGEAIDLYVADLSDGSLTTTTTTTAADVANTTELLTIGADSDGANQFTGLIAYPFVRDDWLSADDVRRIINRGVAYQPKTARLVGWWTFRNSSGADDSGNSNTIAESGDPTYPALTDLYDVVLFHGYTKRFRMEASQRQALVECEDLLGALARHDNTVALVTDQDTGALVDDVLDAFGWDSSNRVIETGLSDVEVAGWSDGAKTVLDQLSEREHGLFLIDPSGWPEFQNRDYRRQRTGVSAQANFDGSDLVVDSNYELDDENIYNDIIIQSTPANAQATEVLWTLQATPLLQDGDSITFVARFRDPDTGEAIKAGSVINPASTTDYTANSLASGSGTDRTANLTVTPTIKADQASLACAASGAALYITKLQIRGAPYEEYDAVEIEKEDATSQTAYQKRTLSIGNRFFDDVVDSEEYAEMLLERFKDPIGKINPVTIQANRSIDQLFYAAMLTISDRITITDSLTGLSGEAFFIEKVTHEITHGDEPHHRVVWVVAPVSAYGYWVLGTSEFDGETTLAY